MYKCDDFLLIIDYILGLFFGKPYRMPNTWDMERVAWDNFYDKTFL